MSDTAIAMAPPINTRGLRQMMKAVAALLLVGNVMFACGGKPGHEVRSAEWWAAGGASGWPPNDSGGGDSGGGGQ